MLLQGKEKVKQYPTEVTEKPMVSVCVQAYRHGKYIKECLDSLLQQKTTFDFEILVGEDNSPDDTRAICIEYAERHPDKIRLFLHDRSNVIYVLGRPTGRYNFIYNLQAVNGKYIALCEGDDYWSDENKLQKQFDFLESHPDYGLVHTDFNWFNEVDKTIDQQHYATNNIKAVADGHFEEYILNPVIRTVTVCFRQTLVERYFTFYAQSNLEMLYGDIVLYSLISNEAKIGYIPDSTATYRRLPESASVSKNIKKQYEFFQNGMDIWLELLAYLDKPKSLKIKFLKNITPRAWKWALRTADIPALLKHSWFMLRHGLWK